MNYALTYSNVPIVKAIIKQTHILVSSGSITLTAIGTIKKQQELHESRINSICLAVNGTLS